MAGRWRSSSSRDAACPSRPRAGAAVAGQANTPFGTIKSRVKRARENMLAHDDELHDAARAAFERARDALRDTRLLWRRRQP